MLNHIPVLGTLFIALVLGYGVFRKSPEVTRLGLVLTVLLALVTFPIFRTGEGAEEAVEDQPWFDEQLVEQHEEHAEAGLIAVLTTGALGMVVLWLRRRGRAQARLAPGVVLLGLLISAGLFGWAALAGGQIRHDELGRAGAAAAVETGESPDDAD